MIAMIGSRYKLTRALISGRLYTDHFSQTLRKRIKGRREQEAFTRPCDYNLERLCYLKYLKYIFATGVWNA